jgi:hypothetical protein
MRFGMSGHGRCALIALVALVGCADPDPIRQYKVAKQAPDDTFTPSVSTPTTREQPEQRGVAWFFKLLGPESAVSSQAETFAKLVRSVDFGADGKPEWKLPEGWTERAESGLRLATIEIPGEPKLEISVMALPAKEPGSLEYLLSNFNRWRNQLGLENVEGGPGLKESRDRGEVQEFELQGRKFTLVNLSGKTSDSGDSRMLAAMIVPESKTEAQNVAAETAAHPPDGLPFTFTRPEGWKDAPLRTFQLLAFTAGDGEKPLSISIAAVGGDVTANVNRWRGQAGLSEVTESEINADARSIPFDGTDAKYFVVEGAERAILGVIAQHRGAQWFIKADGPKSLAQQERAKFEEFVKSIRFK